MNYAPNKAAARMVVRQLETRDVADDRVKSVMARIPRHRFIPGCREGEGYGDHPVAIGHEQTISQPYMVAIMTQELGLAGSERILEVGTGSGYQTAVLAELAEEVFTIERIPALAARARVLLEELGYTNVHFMQGDGSRGWASCAPFDRILVAAAAPEVPADLRTQLADTGLLVMPVGDVDGYQRLVTVRREGDSYRVSSGIGCRFVPLVVP